MALRGSGGHVLQVQDAAVGVQKGRGQGDEGVLHPHAADLGCVVHEEHALILGQALPEHEAGFVLRLRGGQQRSHGVPADADGRGGKVVQGHAPEPQAGSLGAGQREKQQDETQERESGHEAPLPAVSCGAAAQGFCGRRGPGTACRLSSSGRGRSRLGVRSAGIAAARPRWRPVPQPHARASGGCRACPGPGPSGRPGRRR